MANYPKNRKRGSGLANRGKVRSLEFRKKVSDSMKKVIHTPERNAKISKALMGNTIRGKGWHHPQVVLDSISKTRKIRYASGRIKKMIGVENPNWIADRTQLAKYKNGNEYRNSPAHREWSRQVKNRDGWKCKISNDTCSGQVVAHHILSWRDFVELRYEINNGITLCQFHHPRKRVDEALLLPFFQRLVMAEMQ